MIHFKIYVLLLISLTAFAEDLPEVFWQADRPAFKEAIQSRKISVQDWAQKITTDQTELVCLGETHSTRYRNLYRDNFFATFKFDVLFVEDTPEGVQQMLEAVENNDLEFQFLGAPIVPLLKQILSVNPSVKIVGIEETDAQEYHRNQDRIRTGSRRMSREGFIAMNAFKSFEPGKKHVMLYGALHCAHNDLGLNNNTSAFTLLQRALPETKMTNVRIHFRDRATFLHTFMEIAGMPRRQTYLLNNTPSIEKVIYNHVWKLRTLFVNYDSIILSE